MSTRIATILCTLGLLAPATASAQEQGQEGRFSVRFDKITDNCSKSGLKLETKDMAISRQGRRLEIDIDGVPTLVGKVGRRGKLRAETTAASTLGATKTATSDKGKFALNGRVSGEGALQGVFMVEFYKGDQPLCTQSWSLSGKKAK